MSQSPSPLQTSPKTLKRPPGPRSSMPPSINSLDFSIYSQGGWTSSLDYTMDRLQAAKLEPAPDLMTRIEELTREMGYLRLEVGFYRQCFDILQRFRERSQAVYEELLLASYFPPSSERLQEITLRLHHALEDSVKRETTAGSEWKAFWGVKRTGGDPGAEEMTVWM